ncbi:MAG: polysaccharide deacetylase family protein [Candidatus Omnitrophica bacterium]|nr:polysaccharide deacetylase family protein [Candidatus Omnitrophota bacterium]
MYTGRETKTRKAEIKSDVSDVHYVVKLFAFWLDVPVGEVEPLVNQKDIEKLGSLLVKKQLPFFDRYARMFGQPILGFLPERLRYRITDVAKAIRNVKYYHAIKRVERCAFVKIYLELKRKLNVPGLRWNGKNAAVVLTHDIDSSKCYRYLPRLLELERKFGLRSSVNFLTHWGYTVDAALVRSLSKDGFEIGLHGYTHDADLGNKPKRFIEKHISRALKDLNFPVVGYRAPAFGVSTELLEVLDKKGFKYDSSMKLIDHIGTSAELCFPYKYPGLNIWEIPLTVQDDRVFRDKRLNDEEGVGIVKELVERVIKSNGVAVINTHPRLIQKHVFFYNDLLEWLAHRSDIWVATPAHLIAYVEDLWVKRWGSAAND